MTTYTITTGSPIVTRDDGAQIPPDPKNSDYSAYLAWVAEGNSATVLEEPHPTVSEQALLNSNAADLRAKGLAYLALPAPTQAQTTKAVRALVMLAIQKLDDMSGT